jgi:hypothetical protein
MGFAVSFIARYLSLTSTGMLKTTLPTKTKKMSYFCNISQKMLYFNYLLLFQNPQISWQLFFWPFTSKSIRAKNVEKF